MFLVLVRWAMVVAMVVLVAIGMWAVVTITRMKREQAIAIAILNQIAARSKLTEKLDALQQQQADRYD